MCMRASSPAFYNTTFFQDFGMPQALEKDLIKKIGYKQQYVHRIHNHFRKNAARGFFKNIA